MSTDVLDKSASCRADRAVEPLARRIDLSRTQPSLSRPILGAKVGAEAPRRAGRRPSGRTHAQADRRTVATIGDVARAAGVSTSTVSYVL
ncbi:MAG TPA: LacI family DNA-binding transcriptional regulator, partial [Demequina sp.]|nr:LacI family DNA-binding transcriptional regulator [Demequina sp.]